MNHGVVLSLNNTPMCESSLTQPNFSTTTLLELVSIAISTTS